MRTEPRLLVGVAHKNKMAAGRVLFQVSVRDTTGSGTHKVIPVRAGMTVGDVKAVFSEHTGVPTHTYRLVFAGRQLKDSDTLQVISVMYSW